jgi:hypothetical protein
MAKEQIELDGKLLDNGSWRRIVDEINIVNSLDQSTTVACTFILTGTTKSDLNDNWNSTKTDFNKVNGRVTLRFSNDTSNYTEDISANDGKHLDCITIVTKEATAAPLSLKCTFICSAAGIPQYGSLGPGGAGTAQFAGQQGQFKKSVAFNSSEQKTIIVSGRFGLTFNPNAVASNVITTAADAGGYLKLTVTTAPPTFVQGMRVTVAGLSPYNGTHIISAIDVGAKTITTTALWTGSATLSTPTAVIGTVVTGQANYDAVESTLYSSWLTVGTAGKRDDTTGMVLISKGLEYPNNDETIVDFVLEAHYQPRKITAINDNQRGFSLNVSTSFPESWNELAGPMPTFVNCTGSINLLDGEDLKQSFGTALGEIESTVASISETDSLAMISQKVAYDEHNATIGFSILYRADGNDIIEFKRLDTEKINQKLIAWQDADGNDYLQRPNGLPEAFYTISIQRIGAGKANLEPRKPIPPGGGEYIEIGRNRTEEGPFETQWTSGVYDQTLNITYQRFKLGSSGGGGGGSVSGPVFTGGERGSNDVFSMTA